MGRINVGKVIVGGLVAGVVMNILDFLINNYLLKGTFDAALIARNLSPDAMMATNIITQMVALDFVMAIVLVFTYAAIRPRFGAGPKTAIIAALILAAATSTLAGYFTAMGFFPWSTWVAGTVASTANFLVSGLVGGAFYNE